MQFQVGKPSNEPYIATMGNETTLDFKSKLEKIETLRKDNDKEALKDDPPDAQSFMFSHINYHRISLSEEGRFEVNIEYTKVDQKWFQKIMLPREWLSDSVCDCCLHYSLIYKICWITNYYSL
ncbi:hypothetical protein CK203_014460 [Vitis vinifera]|uniref:Uncharacterized protein n=1 Tax=Vitis vinifera TaxID=29760 RepID=A0A438K549_VITVI|nr:hypothetical protein CK203_014460 [Vitis vinifera]